MQTTVKLSAAEYLEWEAGQEIRHEYYYGEIIEMPGSKKKHNKIIGNCYRKIADTVIEAGCEIYTEDVKLRVDKNNVYTYPDLMVTCEPESPEEEYFVDEPVLLIDVLSDSTAWVDHGDKLIYYRRMPALQQYLIVWQHKMRVEAYSRISGGWRYDVYEQPEDIIPITRFEINLPLSAVYSRTATKSA